MNYKRRENESDFEWKARICKMKLSKDIDLDWDEIVVLLGLDVHRDSLRKSAYGIVEAYDFYQNKFEKNIDDDDLLQEYELKRAEFEKEKIKMRDQKNQYRKLIREIARVDYLKEYIEDTARVVAKEKPLEWKHREFETFGNNEGVVLFGDYHFGLEIDNFLNTYNKEIFQERIKKHVAKTIEYGRLHNISKLYVLNLNDMVSGIIHTTTRIMNNEDVISQIQYVAEVFAEVLVEFANNFKEVEFYSVLDNHSRVTPNVKEGLNTESFARIIPWYLNVRLADIDNVKIVKNELDDDIAIFDICGRYKAFAVHGHKDSPKDVVQKLSLMTKVFPDFIFMAHYHRTIEDNVNGITLIGNPSGIGVDEYAKGLRLTGQAQQKFTVFNENEGRICTYTINLQ